MADPNRPRGRGAAILEAMKRKEQREITVGAPEQASTSVAGPSAEQPPKPKGRAALLQKLRESQKAKVGAEGVEASTSTAQVPVTSAAASAKTSPEKTVSRLSEKMQDVSISSEPTLYRGEKGKLINIAANYIRLAVEKDCGVFEYEVRFNPELDSKQMRFKIVDLLMGKVRLFDGGSILYLPKKVTDTQVTKRGSLPGPDGDKEIAVTFIFKRKKRMGECLHLYNILFKRIMRILSYSQMGRNYFNTDHKHLIPQHKLEVYPGFAVTVDEMEGGVMLCMDTQHRVLRTQNAYEFLMELRHSDPRKFKEAAVNGIVGSCVLTRYNNKTYIIDDIHWDMSPKDVFDTRDGRKISFIEYYKTQYNLTIRDLDQPLLINKKSIKKAGSSEKEERIVCLVPEFCFLTGLTDAMRNDFKVMKDVAQYTRVTPNQRAVALRTYLENVRKSEKAQEVLAEWGLRIENGVIDLGARQLESETIMFGNRNITCNNNCDWNRDVGNYTVVEPVDIYDWIVFHTQRDAKFAQNFVQTMLRLGSVMGCQIGQPQVVMLPNDMTDTYFTACKQHIKQNTQIVVFICPTQRSDRYSVIKKVCCTQIPVPSQVILSKTLSNPQKVRSIIQKIALQMTCKLGGTLWTVKFPFKGWMICGIDVYHGVGQKSVCGFVCSLNEAISRWFSLALFQDKEISDFYKMAFTRALEKFKHENGYFPKNVIIFRDGTGDGQLEQCRRYEIEQFESVLREFNLETKICFIVVQKRISTRLFLKESKDLVNPNPGTVLDHTVTRRNMTDFFLISQSVRQGTVNPTHYIVLHDTCNLKPDHVQRLSYKLCHLYYNWPGTIRVPAPCLYAHKCASLVGQHIKKIPNISLADKLYYL